jgi:PIN domain nuclease of toxin-antitoxin system
VILLDTHVVLWLGLSPRKLSEDAISAIRKERDSRGGLAISGITLYEIALLSTKGRVNLHTSPESFLQELESQFVVKPITGRICAETMRLPDAYPKDPMDRMIGATAIVEGLRLVTADIAIQKSKVVETVW